MPNALVFPGGVADKVDFSPRWRNVIQEDGLVKQYLPQGVNRPLLIKSHAAESVRRQWAKGVQSNEIEELGITTT